MDLTAFNLDYTIGDDLREKPVKADEFIAAIRSLEQEVKGNVDAVKRGKIHSKLGSLLRIVGRNEDSLMHHLKADEIFQTDKVSRFLNRVRMASAYQFLNQHHKAVELLETCWAETRTNSAHSEFADFVHQHLGKVYFEMGALEQAMNQIELALALRNEKGDEELIRSSKFALARIISHVKESKTTKSR